MLDRICDDIVWILIDGVRFSVCPVARPDLNIPWKLLSRLPPIQQLLCWVNVGPASQTADQHKINIGPTSHVCRWVIVPIEDNSWNIYLSEPGIIVTFSSGWLNHWFTGGNLDAGQIPLCDLCLVHCYW